MNITLATKFLNYQIVTGDKPVYQKEEKEFIRSFDESKGKYHYFDYIGNYDNSAAYDENYAVISLWDIKKLNEHDPVQAVDSQFIKLLDTSAQWLKGFTYQDSDAVYPEKYIDIIPEKPTLFNLATINAAFASIERNHLVVANILIAENLINEFHNLGPDYIDILEPESLDYQPIFRLWTADIYTHPEVPKSMMYFCPPNDFLGGLPHDSITDKIGMFCIGKENSPVKVLIDS